MISHSKCPRCNTELVHIKNERLDYLLCENCGAYKNKGQTETLSYGIIIMEKKKETHYIPVIRKEDIPELKKTLIGRKKLNVWTNGRIKSNFL